MTAAERFAQARPRLLRLAYSELGDVGEAEDVVQEAWLRLERADAEAIENLDGWLTTVVARLALDRLRSARARRETYVGPWLPEPLVSDDPADRVTLDESVSYALLTVLEQLSPAERTAFVLHDVFDVPFGDVAEVVGRTPEAVRQLASRARRHVTARAPALRGLARRARSRRASVRAGGRRGQPRGPCRGARPGCRLDVGRRRARERRAQAAARRGAGRARVGGAQPQVIHEPIEIELNGRLGLVLPSERRPSRGALVRRQRRSHHAHRRDPQPGEAAAPLTQRRSLARPPARPGGTGTGNVLPAVARAAHERSCKCLRGALRSSPWQRVLGPDATAASNHWRSGPSLASAAAPYKGVSAPAATGVTAGTPAAHGPWNTDQRPTTVTVLRARAVACPVRALYVRCGTSPRPPRAPRAR